MFGRNRETEQQDEEKKEKEKRATAKLAHAFAEIDKLEFLSLKKLLDHAELPSHRFRNKLPGRRGSEDGLERRWKDWIDKQHWFKHDYKETYVKKLEKSGIVPHGIPITLFSKKKPLQYAFIHYWMKSDVRLTNYCHEALERMCGRYLVYFLQTGSHIIDPRIFSIDVDRNVILKPLVPRQATQDKPSGFWRAVRYWILRLFGVETNGEEDDDQDQDSKKKRDLDDTFHVTEWLWDDDKEKKRCGPLIPFERFHTATLVPARNAPEPAQASTIELASERSDPTELDAEFLVLQDEGGDQISGTFQFKGTIGKFRGRRRKNIPEVGPLQKTPQIPLEKLSEMNGIDRQLIDDLLNDLNMNSHRADP